MKAVPAKYGPPKAL